MPREFFHDFETRSTCDLKKAGAYAYGRHPDTEVLCLAYAFDDGPIKLWLPGDPLPEVYEDDFWVAHNVGFEMAIWAGVFGIEVPIKYWIDTAAIARYQSLPGKLEDLGHCFGFEKDMEGNKIALKLCKPRRPSKANPDQYWEPETKPEEFKRLYVYCKRDVHVMRECKRRMRLMPPGERKIWIETHKINARGLPIDVDYIRPIKAALANEARDIEAEVGRLTGGLRTSQTAKITEWAQVDNLQAKSLERLVPKLKAGPVKTVLEARMKLSKASLRKIPRIEAMLVDGRVHGTLVHAGADRTGRWSGYGIQPQNLPRGLKGEELDSVFDDLAVLVASRAKPNEIMIEDAFERVSNALKGLIIPPSGCDKWIVADYSQIECRVLAWLAGETKLIEVFENGQDPYKVMASAIYNTSVDQIDSDQRFMGKQVILGSGFGMGAAKFTQMLDETYNVQITEDFAQELITTYRQTYPLIVKFWYDAERAFRKAMSGRTVKLGKLLFAPDLSMPGKHVSIQLPSGRKLFYNNVALDNTGTIRYLGKNQYTRKIEMLRTYAGKLVENCTQGTARDVMAVAMLRLEKAGFPIHLTVHDEILAAMPRVENAIAKFDRLMNKRPSWAKDLPIASESGAVYRYQKG